MTIDVDVGRLTRELKELATFSASAPPSVTRILFSEPDMRAREWLAQCFSDAGLAVRHDSVGNTFARWTGTEPGLPPIATGSHIDAIPEAGAYDGTVGVLGGLEAIRALRRSGLTPRRSIELVLFTSEEPTRFGVGCIGSRLLSGTLDPHRVDALCDSTGLTLADLRKRAGFDGDLRGVPMRRGAYEAFLELHIEQGPLLEHEGIDLGAVTHIAAPASLQATFTGEGGHAGTVLMSARRDALLGAAELALAVESAAKSTGAADSVATTGVFEISPGAVNSIPNRARLGIDVRDIDEKRRDEMIEQIVKATGDIAHRRSLQSTVDVVNADPPAVCDPVLVDMILNAAEQASRRSIRIVSRAYHDTLFMARIAPVAMIFIPCRDGVSHRPDEYASPEAIGGGVEVLAWTLARLASG